MKTHLLLLLLSGVSTLSIGCSGGGECATAFDKQLECGDMSDSRKEKAKKYRDEAISACKKSKDDPEIKAAIKCGKVSSCEEYKSCTTAARADGDIQEIEAFLKEGKVGDALGSCKYSLDTFTEVPAFKTACEKAFTAAFAKLDDKEIFSDLRYLCTQEDDYKKWEAASEVVAKGCNSIVASHKTKITKQRDDGSEYNYSDCSYYKDLIKTVAPKEAAAADLLCSEAEMSDDFTEGFESIKKNVAEKSTMIPFRCSSILESDENTKKFATSEWFKGKSKEFAAVCYSGDLAKLILNDVSSYCLSGGKTTHKMIAKFALPVDDELKGLLEKTAAMCTK